MFYSKVCSFVFCVNYGAIKREKESDVVQSDRLIHLYEFLCYNELILYNKEAI